MFHRGFFVAFGTWLAATACGTGGGPLADAADDASTTLDGGDGTSLPDAPTVDTPGATPHTYRATITAPRLDPGQETTVCVVRRLGNDAPQYVRRVRAHLGDASHHLIFYRSTATMERTTPFPCTAFSGVLAAGNGAANAPMLVAQDRDSTLEMPAGVGVNIEADQMVRIEYHTVNVGSAPIEPTAEVGVDTVDRVGTVQPADILFWGNLSINLPPHTPPQSPVQVHFFHRPWEGVRVL
jgi:hypothetical protein